MRLTPRRLKQIIQEELQRVLNEKWDHQAGKNHRTLKTLWEKVVLQRAPSDHVERGAMDALAYATLDLWKDAGRPPGAPWKEGLDVTAFEEWVQGIDFNQIKPQYESEEKNFPIFKGWVETWRN